MDMYLRRGVMMGVVVLLMSVLVGSAMAQEGETVYITSPGEGEIVSGIVTLTGAVDFPGFLKYEIFLRNGDLLSWAATVYAPVVNGNLARLDTRTFNDGIYQIVIRKVRADSNYTDEVGPTIIIENNLGGPLPYPEVSPSYLYAPLGAAVLRVRNCSGTDIVFDYQSPEGFCSGGRFEMPFKEQTLDFCPTTDIRLIACEYRGTVSGLGEGQGGRYEFVAEPNKVYLAEYGGGDQVFIREVQPDERAPTDTGGGNQTAAAISTQGSNSGLLPTPPPPVADSTTAMLPVSGAGSAEAHPVFIAAGVGLILLLLVGGVVASRRRYIDQA